MTEFSTDTVDLLASAIARRLDTEAALSPDARKSALRARINAQQLLATQHRPSIVTFRILLASPRDRFVFAATQ
ncbi:hypothetical protein [Streptomyces sp. RTd22]|uniref:hypothetical protein n=1 Tax=Streptomyces sp. RTd22 TaxID=1841249 RepID=UPI0007D8CFF7|nr:hypothetical protein [Streptomyces sp. RTd22]